MVSINYFQSEFLNVSAVRSEHDFKIAGLAYPFKIVVIERQLFSSYGEIHLNGFPSRNVQLAEALEFLDRAGGAGVNVVNIELDYLIRVELAPVADLYGCFNRTVQRHVRRTQADRIVFKSSVAETVAERI